MHEYRHLLSGFPLVTSIPLLWGDEDAFGHVNNLAYLRWCETARVEYLQKIGLWTELPPTGTGPILASVKCDYKRQLTYPDTVHIGTRVTKIGNSSLRMEHHVVSQKACELAAVADSTLVVFDYTRGKTTAVPPEVRRVIENLEGRHFDAHSAAKQPQTVR